MRILKKVRGKEPVIGKNSWLAENAVVVGDVALGKECSVWFHAIIRGDVNSIRIGDKVNIQDAAIIHCTYEKADVVIGNNVSIGHRAIVHGCHIEDNVLIGMGAIVMDHALVQSNSVVAAGAVVTENMVVESGWIYAGIPAKKLKPLDVEKHLYLIQRTADNYRMYAGWFQDEK